MKIKTKKTMTHGEFAKYLVDKCGIASFERNLAGGEWFDVPIDIYNASINLKPAKHDDFPHVINIDEDGVTLKIFEEITEDTEIKHLVYIDDNNDIEVLSNFTIRELKGNDFKEFHAYIDGEFKLIWTREKGLVE